MNSGRASGRVLAGLDRLDGRGDATGATVDLDEFEDVGVLHRVAEAEVAQATRVTGDALNEDVVVLRGAVVGARGTLFSIDLIGEVVERTRVRARSVKSERPGPGTTGRPGSSW